MRPTGNPSLRSIVAVLWLAFIPLLLPGSLAADAGGVVGCTAVGEVAEPGAEPGTAIAPVTTDVPHDLRLAETPELGVTVVESGPQRRQTSSSTQPATDARHSYRLAWRRAARTSGSPGALGCSRCSEGTAFDSTPPPFPPGAR